MVCTYEIKQLIRNTSALGIECSFEPCGGTLLDATTWACSLFRFTTRTIPMPGNPVSLLCSEDAFGESVAGLVCGRKFLCSEAVWYALPGDCSSKDYEASVQSKSGES